MIFIHTHTGHCYGNIPASICPPSCLLCYYSSHPRIVSFSAYPSLVFVTHKLAVETTIQFVLPSAFPFTFFSVTEEQLSPTRTLGQCTPRGEFQTDHHWFELPWRWQMSFRVTCCMIMYLKESFADTGCNLSIDTFIYLALFPLLGYLLFSIHKTLMREMWREEWCRMN